MLGALVSAPLGGRSGSSTRGPGARRLLVMAFAVLLLAKLANAQQPDINYDESRVPAYSLPDPLVTSSGERVTTPEAWREQRRPEILHLFERYIYGKAPGRPADLAFEVT